MKKKTMSQKQMIKQAVNDIKSGKKRKIVIKLTDKNYNIKPLPVLWFNKIVLFAQQWWVPMNLKNWTLRRTGMKVGKDACIPHYIHFDPYFPELIHLGKGTLIGGGSNVYTHTIKGKELTLGKVDLKDRVMVAGMVTLDPGTVVNENSMISLHSVVDKEVPSGELWSGNPAKCTMKLSQELIDKYFKKLPHHHKEYYKDFRKKVNAFINDPNQMYFKAYYGGTREGAGSDWWRARNTVRIFYNGILVEIARIMPHCWLKTLILRMMGAKIGKNVYIGKGTVFDHIYGDMVTLEDNVRVDNDCYFDGHEYTISQTVFGRSVLKKGVHLKHHSFVRCGAVIGENSVIEPWSMAQKEIPPDEVWGGMPAKFIRKKGNKAEKSSSKRKKS